MAVGVVLRGAVMVDGSEYLQAGGIARRSRRGLSDTANSADDVIQEVAPFPVSGMSVSHGEQSLPLLNASSMVRAHIPVECSQ